MVKQLDEERKAAVEQLKHVIYFHRQKELQGQLPSPAEIARLLEGME